MIRTRKALTLLVSALLLLAASAAPASAQSAAEPKAYDSVTDLRAATPLDETARLIGFVSAERRVASATFKGYYITDRFGVTLLVRTTNPLPEVLTRLTVAGVLLRDARTREMFLVETGRLLQPEITRQPEVSTEVRTGRIKTDTEVLGTVSAERRALEGAGAVGAATANAQAEKSQAASPSEPSLVRRLLSLSSQEVMLGIALLLLLSGVLYFSRGRLASRVKTPAPYDSPSIGGQWTAPAVPQASASAFAAPESVPGPTATAMPAQDFKTVRVFKTTRLLPVSLEVLNGDEVIETVPLYDQSGQGTIDLGRDVVGETGGVRIKDPSNTLSRRQARIEVDSIGKSVRLTNLASSSSNPTTVNGKILSLNETVELKRGSLIQMGAVQVRVVISIGW